MLASYTTLKSSRCIQCKRLIQITVTTSGKPSTRAIMRSPFSRLWWRPLIQQQPKTENGASLYIRHLVPTYTTTHSRHLSLFLGAGGSCASVYGRCWGFLTWCRTYTVDALQPATFTEGTMEMKSKEQRTRMSWIRLWKFLPPIPLTVCIRIPYKRKQSRSDQKRTTLRFAYWYLAGAPEREEPPASIV